MTKKFSKKQIIESVKNSGGIISTVARQITDCDWHTAKKYVEQSPETKEFLESETEKINDIAESELIKKIKDGDMTAIKYRLSTEAKHRGCKKKLR